MAKFNGVMPKAGWIGIAYYDGHVPLSITQVITNGKHYKFIEVKKMPLCDSGIQVRIKNDLGKEDGFDLGWFKVYYPDTELGRLIYG